MKDLKGFLLRVAYVALASTMFYFNEGYFVIGGFGVMYQYLCAIGIVLIGFTAFLVQPRPARMAVALRYSWALSAHYLWALLYSMLIWGLSLAPVNVFTRGTFDIFYQLIGILAAVATVYLFGREGLRLMMISILVTNVIFVIEAVAENGFGPFFREFVDLIVSFTAQTGSIMKSFENRNLAYPLGFFLVYQVLEYIGSKRLGEADLSYCRERRKDWWLFPLCAVCFLMGMKRSVLGAVTGVFLAGLLLLRQKPRDAKGFSRGLCVVGVALGVAYVIGCYFGFMKWVESIGIDTMSRADFYEKLKPLYEVGLGYFGKGTGYVSRILTDGVMDFSINGFTPGDIHNDFLRQYIELGLLGFIVWMWMFLHYKVMWFYHNLENEIDKTHGVLTLCFTAATYITFMTENTLYFCKFTMLTSLLIMAYHFEEYCGVEEEKWRNYGSVSSSTALMEAGRKR